MRRLPCETLQSWVLTRLTLCDGKIRKSVDSSVADEILKGYSFSADLAEDAASRDDEPHPRLPNFLNSVCETE